MAAAPTTEPKKPNAGFAALWRFLPMLWPKGEAELKARVIAAVLLVLAGKAVTLARTLCAEGRGRPDERRMRLSQSWRAWSSPTRPRASAACCSTILRNAMFEKVGQDATRRLAGKVFRHLHDLSLRFHLERRTGSLTKVVERGTKSIDTMLYFLLFNIAPTVIELDRDLRHLLRQVRRRAGRARRWRWSSSISPSRAR